MHRCRTEPDPTAADSRSAPAPIGSAAARFFPRLARGCAGALLLGFVAGCGTTAPAEQSLPPRLLGMDIGAGKIAEECFKLAAGERVEYQFESNVVLDFNFHTHRGSQIYMPVEIPRTREQSGVFTSPRAEDYCMMWTNQGGVPGRITGQWRRTR